MAEGMVGDTPAAAPVAVARPTAADIPMKVPTAVATPEPEAVAIEAPAIVPVVVAAPVPLASPTADLVTASASDEIDDDETENVEIATGHHPISQLVPSE